MIYMEIAITTCFYENPGALQEIKFWEGLIYDQIEYKFKEDPYIIFLLNKLKEEKYYNYEMVICTPMEDFDHGLAFITKHEKYKIGKMLGFPDITFIHHKTLVFGKVDENILKNIGNYISKYK